MPIQYTGPAEAQPADVRVEGNDLVIHFAGRPLIRLELDDAARARIARELLRPGQR